MRFSQPASTSTFSLGTLYAPDVRSTRRYCCDMLRQHGEVRVSILFVRLRMCAGEAEQPVLPRPRPTCLRHSFTGCEGGHNSRTL